MNEALELLRLQVEWGADAALAEMPQDRFTAPAPARPSERRGGARPMADGSAWDRPGAGRAMDDRDPPPHDWGADAPASHGQAASHGLPPGTPQSGAARRPPQGRVAIPPPVDPYLPVNRATTVEALRQAIQAFEGCALRATATTTLFPQGPVGAPVMFIGDAPDADEDRSGQVFAGANGALLDKMLASIGLQRDDIALACALPWRPPGGRPPTAEELRVCLPLLHRAITLFAPQRLVLCGGLATRLLTGETASPARMRGKWRDVAVPALAVPEIVGDAACHPQASAPAQTPLQIAALSTRHPLQLRASAAARREIWSDLVILTITLRDNSANSIKATE